MTLLSKLGILSALLFASINVHAASHLLDATSFKIVAPGQTIDFTTLRVRYLVDYKNKEEDARLDYYEETEFVHPKEDGTVNLPEMKAHMNFLRTPTDVHAFIMIDNFPNGDSFTVATDDPSKTIANKNLTLMKVNAATIDVLKDGKNFFEAYESSLYLPEANLELKVHEDLKSDGSVFYDWNGVTVSQSLRNDLSWDNYGSNHQLYPSRQLVLNEFYYPTFNAVGTRPIKIELEFNLGMGPIFTAQVNSVLSPDMFANVKVMTLDNH